MSTRGAGAEFSPRGVIVAMVTPVRSDGAVDIGAVARLVQRAASARVHGLSPSGSTGEGALLTRSARLGLAARVRELAPPDLPVIPGVPVTNLDDAQSELKDLAAEGATAALVAPPAYYPLSESGVFHLFADLADASPIPLLLYNIPVFTKIGLAPALVGRLASHPNIAGIKDSSGDLEYQQSVIAAVAGENFAVLTGKDTLLVQSLVMGAAGTIAASANVAADLTVGIWNAFESGDQRRALELQDRLCHVIGACRTGFFPAGWKAAAEAQGICRRFAVAPGTALDDEQFVALQNWLNELLVAAG